MLVYISILQASPASNSYVNCSQETSVINSQIFTVLTRRRRGERLKERPKECLKTTQMMTLLLVITNAETNVDGGDG